MKARGMTGWAVGVVIPAQDEAETIEHCIRAVVDSYRQCRWGDRLWIVVAADSCSDRTAAFARRALGTCGEVVECAVHSPGAARRIGAQAALEHFHDVALDRMWLANTDADTWVPADWLRLHLEFAQDGETAVAGIVQLGTLPGDGGEVAALFRDSYHLGNDGSHTHVHGANFGVRGDAYVDVGGWSPVSVAEDHCLWGRLKSGGWRLRSSVRSIVTTSARLHGRACGGFADTLRKSLEASLG